jgi:molybdopterin biosynthesis enzyme
MTGARVPVGADAVQKKELARETTSSGGESHVEILRRRNDSRILF